MTMAMWCVLVAVLAPYLLSVAARSQARRADYMDDPRAYSDQLLGWQRRAHLAHLNAFEAVPGFAAAVLIAEFVQAPRTPVDALALAFIALRAAHAACYIADKPIWRSHAWRLGMLCVIGLFVVAAIGGRS
ncbi:MAG: MAPEG family protein [Rubrivivax sp.]|nr:MAPEG family protein [Rubrivivax sp.]